jgi:hypothetical protein
MRVGALGAPEVAWNRARSSQACVEEQGGQGGDDLRAAAPSLLPVLTRRGLVDFVESPQDITGPLLFVFA